MLGYFTIIHIKNANILLVHCFFLYALLNFAHFISIISSFDFCCYEPVFLLLFLRSYITNSDCTPHSVWKVMIFFLFYFSDSLYNVILFIRLRFVNCSTLYVCVVFFSSLVHLVYTQLVLFLFWSVRIEKERDSFAEWYSLESILCHSQEI